MSNKYERCDFCEETMQVSCTGDTDFGARQLGRKWICFECRQKICENLK